jgi:mono/diheme cytochrome c family protein
MLWISLNTAALLGAAACSDQQSDDRSAPASPAAPAPGATPPAPAAPPPPAAPPAPPAPTAAVDGKTVYTTYCATCHGPTGQGDGPGAAALEPKPRNFAAGEFKFDPTGDGKTGEPEDLVEVVKNGAAQYGGSPLMVPWGTSLNEQQIGAVVEYVKSLKGS